MPGYSHGSLHLYAEYTTQRKILNNTAVPPLDGIKRGKVFEFEICILLSSPARALTCQRLLSGAMMYTSPPAATVDLAAAKNNDECRNKVRSEGESRK